MSSIKITLVRIGNTLVGKTFSDRWNLETLGMEVVPYDRNQTAIKRLRRANPDLQFAFEPKSLQVTYKSTRETGAMRASQTPYCHHRRLNLVSYDPDTDQEKYRCLDCLGSIYQIRGSLAYAESPDVLSTMLAMFV